MKLTRHIDPQGRIQIPSLIRKELNLSEGGAVTLEFGSDRTIRIKPAKEESKKRGGRHGND